MESRYTWVASDEGVRSMLKELRSSTRMALDIESDSLYHYFEKVCLIQLSTDHATFLLDPLAVRDLGALGAITADPSLEKVIHAAANDVASLRRDHGFQFANLFDTHMAAQLLGYPKLGLDALLEHHLGVRHSKRWQREDWSRRPLPEDQLEYAAMDARFLLPLRDRLHAELHRKQRWAWALEEFQAAAQTASSAREFDPEGYRRIKGWRELPRERLPLLRALYLQRDALARRMDLPPFKVISNPALLDLARRPPRDLEELGHRAVSVRVLRSFGRDLLEIFRTAREAHPLSAPSPRRSTGAPPPSCARIRLKRLKAWRSVKSQELGLPPGVVFPGESLDRIGLTPPETAEELSRIEGIRQWRVREFGHEIVELCRDQR